MVKRGIKTLKELIDDLVEKRKREVRNKYTKLKEKEVENIRKELILSGVNGIEVRAYCNYFGLEVMYANVEDVDKFIEILSKIKDKLARIGEIHKKQIEAIEKLENWRIEAYKAIIEEKELPAMPEV